MAAQSGRNLQILRGDGASPEVFTRVSGGREESFSINKELIDITDKSSSGWRTYLNGAAGLTSVSASVSGVHLDGVLIADVLAATQRNYQLDIDGVGVFEGAFMIPTYEASGAHSDAITYTVTLESSGVIAYTPEV